MNTHRKVLVERMQLPLTALQIIQYFLPVNPKPPIGQFIEFLCNRLKKTLEVDEK
jgi:hypothetical protein